MSILIPTRLAALAALAAAALTLAPGARAHTDEYLAGVKTPHGGELRMTGPYHLELVARADGAEVYVTDHGDQKIPTAGWTGEVVFLAGGKKTKLTLSPVGDNRLAGSGSVPPADGRQAVVIVQPKPGESHSARYAPIAAKPAAAAAAGGGHDHHAHTH